uniref:Uncharacterized protein n=1 Tax=Myotis myotis TaxID=51298 RepID=A0A7J7Y061_MYOMY|nr:hypothetical protein mMyoMyo1_011499 [Myotis myotis]
MCGGSWAGSVSGSRNPSCSFLCTQWGHPHPTTTCQMATPSGPPQMCPRAGSYPWVLLGAVSWGRRGVRNSEQPKEIAWWTGKGEGLLVSIPIDPGNRGEGPRAPGAKSGFSRCGWGTAGGAAEDGQEVGQSLGWWPQGLPQKTVSHGG